MAQEVRDEELTALREQLRDQGARLDQMDGIVSRLLGGKTVSGPTSRRNFVRLAGAGVIGAAGAAALLPRGASATTGGTDGGALIIGANSGSGNTPNTATALTELIVSNSTAGSTVSGLEVAGDTTAAGTVDALLGFGTNGGAAVIGESDTYLDLKSIGTGRLAQINVGALAGDSPAFRGDVVLGGTPPLNSYELVRGENGEIWAAQDDAVERTAATPRGGFFWKRINTARFDLPDGSGGVFQPVRAIDTRGTSPVASGATLTLQIAPTASLAGVPGIPSTAIGIAGNLTAVSPDYNGFLTAYPGTASRPGTSTLNFVAGGPPTPNGFIVGLGTDGTLKVFASGNFAGKSVQVIVDITAYYQ